MGRHDGHPSLSKKESEFNVRTTFILPVEKEPRSYKQLDRELTDSLETIAHPGTYVDARHYYFARERLQPRCNRVRNRTYYPAHSRDTLEAER